MTFSLIELTDAHMTRPRFRVPETNTHYYPSESSIKYVDEEKETRVEGCCLRQAYFRITGQEGAAKPSAYSEWIFELGKSVEKILVEQWKQMGIWVGNNVKFYNKEYNISGELDALLVEPDGKTLFFVECKSFYGYNATKEIIGNTKQKGRPKTNHLLQSVVYLNELKKQMSYCKLVYYARDSASRAEFNITLKPNAQGTINILVDNSPIKSFTVEDIYARYKLLDEHVKRKEIPPNDYELIWDDDKVIRRYAMGEIAKTKFENWQKRREKIGDWNCNYCNYSSICWGR